MIEENDSLVSVHLDSILDLIEMDTSKYKNKKHINKYLSSNRIDPTWQGRTNKTHKDVLNHGLIGDSVLLKQLESKIEILNKVTGKHTVDYDQQIKKSRRRRTFEDQGDELDIEKVYNGELDTCWSKTERVEFDTEHKFVTLFIENGGLSHVSVNDTFWRAAVAVFLTRELERAGKSVKIVIGSCAQNSMQKCNKLITQSVVVKEYNQRVSLERVAGMTHIGFFRSIGFAIRCLTPYKINGTMGATTDITRSMPIQLEREVNKGHTRLIHIKPVTNQHAAINTLKSAYKQLLATSRQ